MHRCTDPGVSETACSETDFESASSLANCEECQERISTELSSFKIRGARGSPMDSGFEDGCAETLASDVRLVLPLCFDLGMTPASE